TKSGNCTEKCSFRPVAASSTNSTAVHQCQTRTNNGRASRCAGSLMMRSCLTRPAAAHMSEEPPETMACEQEQTPARQHVRYPIQQNMACCPHHVASLQQGIICESARRWLVAPTIHGRKRRITRMAGLTTRHFSAGQDFVRMLVSTTRMAVDTARTGEVSHCKRN